MKTKLLSTIVCISMGMQVFGCSKAPQEQTFTDASGQEIQVRNFQSHFTPLPHSAIAQKAHPRIWIQESDLTRLRNECLGGAKTNQWERLRRYVDRFAAWGNFAIKGSAFCYLILKDSEKEAAAVYVQKVVQSIMTHPHFDNKSYLMRSAVLEAFVLGYDWCYDALSQQQRQEIADKIIDLAQRLNSMGKANISTLHNYTLTSIAPVGLAALALLGDHPSADEVYRAVTKKYADVLKIYDYMKDGGWYEGTDYNRLSSWPSIKFFSALRTAAGINMFEESPFLQNHLYYLIYTLRPDRTFYRGYDVLYPMITDPHRKMLLLLASECQNGHAQWFYENIFASKGLDYPMEGSRGLLPHLIWHDSNLKPLSPYGRENPLPLARYFRGLGLVIMRSDWSFNATWMSFQNHDWLSSHHHADNNAFTIYKKGALAVDAGALAMMRVFSKHYSAYHSRTVAHNTLLIKDPKERWPGVLKLANDGGQRVPRLHVFKNFDAWMNAYSDTNYRGGDKYSSIHLADWIHFEHRPKHYTYLVSDATKSYSSHKVKQYVREFVYLRPHYIVIFDRVGAQSKRFEKSWLAHSINKPHLFGKQQKEITVPDSGIHTFTDVDSIMVDEKEGRLLYQTLLPQQHRVRVVGGPGYEFFVDGKNWTQDKEFVSGAEPGNWRIEVSPRKAQEDEVFLHVLVPTTSLTQTLPSSALLYSHDKKMVGARIDNCIALFSVRQEIIQNTSYSVVHQGPVRHFISDLMPEKEYSIFGNGKFLQKITSTSDGVVYFATKAAGKQKIEIR